MFFFVDQAPNHLCLNGGITTGEVGPYPATVKTVGKTLVMDTPIPGYVSFPTGLEGSLTSLRPELEEPEQEAQERQDRPLRCVGCLQERQASLQRDVHRGPQRRRHPVDVGRDRHSEVQLI